MRQVLRPGALEDPEESGGEGIVMVNICISKADSCQKPLQYWKVISLQLILKNKKKIKKIKKKRTSNHLKIIKTIFNLKNKLK